ncbi:29916_t:CDS:2, partial [Racocetra persica]
PIMSERYPEWLKKEQENGNITVYKFSQFKNVEIIGNGVEVFITNSNRRLIPIITRNVTSTLFPIDLNLPIPSLKPQKED